MDKQLYKITDVLPQDAFFPYRLTFIGEKGYLDGDLKDGIFGGTFTFLHPIKKLGVLQHVKLLSFLAVKVEPIEE